MKAKDVRNNHVTSQGILTREFLQEPEKMYKT